DRGAAIASLQTLLSGCALRLSDVVLSTRRSTRLVMLSDTERVLAGLYDLTGWLHEPGSQRASELYASLSRTLPEAQRRQLARIEEQVLRLPLPPRSSRSNAT